jgi:hypothetical protein
MGKSSTTSSKSRVIPRSVMMQSLRGISILATQTWKLLNSAESLEQEEDALTALWELQENQGAAIDAHAELADQIDAEIAAVKARMEHLVKIHVAELDRLTRWRESLDRTILQLNESGLLGTEAAGQARRIRIKLNPPSCEILNLEEVPEAYITTKTVIDRKADKTAIKAAWNQGIPVPGTHVDRKRKVVYEIAPTSLERMKAATPQ